MVWQLMEFQEGGKPVTKTRAFQRPVTEGELETVWDEQTLRLLLEQSTDYEERRLIRARLRQVMAEQEACTDLVDKASQEQPGGQIEGESLLLPLLQGLLEAPESDQPIDSGVESGEDQRSGLIAEVQSALDKLSASLRSDATDITPERRCSLLQLVTKLQAGLSTTTPKLERRLSSGPGRFNRRRQRQNRHTVGVSSEELADARRLMEEISLRDITPSQSQTKVTVLQKQNSESSVNSNSSSFNKFGHKVPVKNATAKPFHSSSNSNISNTSSSVQTPTDPAESFDLIFNEESGEKKPVYAVSKTSSKGSVERDTKSSSLSKNASAEEISLKTVHKAVQQAAARKKGTSESAQESETEEDDTSTVTAPKEAVETPPPSPLLENPIYSQPDETDTRKAYEEKCRRFNTPSNKLRMKRANTVDIPNGLNVYEDDDSETEDEIQQRKNNYYALRGPIRVGDHTVKKTVMPVFEPKTESDQKFLAFISKNNQSTSPSGSLWSGNQTKTANWGNKFGNLKNAFEKASTGAPSNSARNFWKSADDAVTTGSTPYGPKISRRSARNLQQMFEEKQREAQEKLCSEEQGIVTGSLTLKTEPDRNYKFVPQPMPVNMFSHAPQSAFKPIPPKKVVQKPESLPITPEQDILKTEIKENKNDAPLYLYSPKPLYNSQTSSTTSSPIVTSKPWVTNAIDHGGRVLSMAAKKFEVPPQQESSFVKPRKLSKEINKAFVPQASPPEKMTAPYLVKSAEQKTSTVRKLSDQYDSIGNKPTEYSSQSTVRYPPPPQQEKKHYVPKYTVPEHMAQSYKPPQSTASSYQTNGYNQYNSNTQTRPQYTQQTSQSYETRNYQKPFVPQQNYETHYNSNAHKPQHYNTRYDQQPNTRAYQSSHIQDSEPVDYSVTDPQYTQKLAKQPPHQDFKPVNYSITYDKPLVDHEHSKQSPKPVNYSTQTHSPQKETPSSYTLQANVQQTHQIYQHVPGQEVEPEQEFVSTCQFTPQPNKKPQPKPQIQVHATAPDPTPKLDRQLSNESVCEYTAINSKVMTGPVSQQAVTVRQKSPMSRSEHDMEAAFNLRNSLQKVGRVDATTTSKSPSNSFSYKPSEPKAASPNNSFKYKQSEAVAPNNFNKYGSKQPKPLSPVRYNPEGQNSSISYPKYNPSDVPKPTVCPSSFKSAGQFPQRSPGSETKTFGVVKPMQQKQPAKPIYNNVTSRVRESLEINDKGQSVVTSKFNIPVINVKESSAPNTPTVGQGLSKSDSWYQICMANQTQNSKPSPSTSPTGRPVGRSKSSSTLAVPQKQFEAGMSREELVHKKRAMEAYFAGGTKSPEPPSNSVKIEAKMVKRSINRIKTTEKLSAFRQPTGLCRSRTLPDIICPDMLDESNPDKAFDDLFKSM
ncbi:hypothetical protein NQ315_001785 [Exocentrus adspersus]|uniref:Smoothelin domain-containing protein n=1 Tax=Exocentrus adspersus TaxID=1586481 RepID=A0AAV8W9G7_9CUCU|nr:hypothetical protein NQ315_001785 [Exocentrus adspersus]